MNGILGGYQGCARHDAGSPADFDIGLWRTIDTPPVFRLFGAEGRARAGLRYAAARWKCFSTPPRRSEQTILPSSFSPSERPDMMR